MKCTTYESPESFETTEWINEWMNDDEDNSIRIYLSGDLTFQKLITKREQISKDEQNTHKQNMKEMQIYIIWILLLPLPPILIKWIYYIIIPLTHKFADKWQNWNIYIYNE